MKLLKCPQKPTGMLHASNAVRNASDFKSRGDAFDFFKEWTTNQFHVVQLIQQVLPEKYWNAFWKRWYVWRNDLERDVVVR